MLCREHGSFDDVTEKYPARAFTAEIGKRSVDINTSMDFGEKYKENCPYIRQGFLEMAAQIDDAIAMLESSSKYDFFYMIKHPEENDAETQKYVDYFRSIIDIEWPYRPDFMCYWLKRTGDKGTDWNTEDDDLEKELRDAYYLRDDDRNRKRIFENLEDAVPGFPCTHRRFFLHKSTYHKGWDYENERPMDATEDEKYISQDEFDCNVRRIIGELKWFRMVYIELNPKKMMDFTMQKIREYIRNETGIIFDSEFYCNPVPFKENLAVYMANKEKEKRLWNETYKGISEWRDLLDDEKVREMKVQFDVNNQTGFDVSQRDFIDAFMDSMQFNNLPKETSKAIFTALDNKGMEVMKYFGQSKPQEKSAASKAWERFNAKNPEFGKNPQKWSRQYDMISFISTFGAMYETTAEAEKDVNAKGGLLPLLMSFFGKDVRECPFDIEIDERNKKLTVTMRIGEKQDDTIGENIITDASIICAMLAMALPSHAAARKVSGIAVGYRIYEGIQKIRNAYYGNATFFPEFKFPYFVITDSKYIGSEYDWEKREYAEMSMHDYHLLMKADAANEFMLAHKSEIYPYLRDESYMYSNLVLMKHNAVSRFANDLYMKYQSGIEMNFGKQCVQSSYSKCCKATFIDNRGYARDFYENYERDWNYYNQKLGELSSGILLNGI